MMHILRNDNFLPVFLNDRAWFYSFSLVRHFSARRMYSAQVIPVSVSSSEPHFSKSYMLYSVHAIPSSISSWVANLKPPSSQTYLLPFFPEMRTPLLFHQSSQSLGANSMSISEAIYHRVGK